MVLRSEFKKFDAFLLAAGCQMLPRTQVVAKVDRNVLLQQGFPKRDSADRTLMKLDRQPQPMHMGYRYSSTTNCILGKGYEPSNKSHVCLVKKMKMDMNIYRLWPPNRLGFLLQANDASMVHRHNSMVKVPDAR